MLLLAAAGLWLARSSRDSDDTASTISTSEGQQTADANFQPGQTNGFSPQHAPPDPTRRFRDFTPEQRVEFARKGRGPGG